MKSAHGSQSVLASRPERAFAVDNVYCLVLGDPDHSALRSALASAQNTVHVEAHRAVVATPSSPRQVRLHRSAVEAGRLVEGHGRRNYVGRPSPHHLWR